MITASEALPRVAYVVKRYPRYSETFIVNEILAHEEAGLEVEIFALRPPEDSHFQDVIARVRAPVHYLPQLGNKATSFWQAIEEAGDALPEVWKALPVARGERHRDIYQALVLARAVRLKGIGHLHAHFASSATTVARLASHFAEIPYSFTAHAKDIYHCDVDIADLRRKLCDAESVVTVSDYNLDHLRTELGPAAACVSRIYNGLDLTRFSFQDPEGRPPRIVAVGRLVEKKGLRHLVDACALLVERGQPFHCRIIGSGELEGDLRAQVEQLGLRERVELVGARPQAEVGEEIRRAAVFAAPCVVGADGNRDGLPTVLLEAMASGTPVVSTDVTGIPEVVRDGDTGLMVPQRDPAALADALQRLLLDPALGVQLATRARSLIEEQFEIRRNTIRLRQLFTESNREAVCMMEEVS